MTIITCYTWGKKHDLWGAQFWQRVLNVKFKTEGVASTNFNYQLMSFLFTVTTV